MTVQDTLTNEAVYLCHPVRRVFVGANRLVSIPIPENRSHEKGLKWRYLCSVSSLAAWSVRGSVIKAARRQVMVRDMTMVNRRYYQSLPKVRSRKVLSCTDYPAFKC